MGLAFTVMLMILSSIFLHGPVKHTKLMKLMECIVDIKIWMTNKLLLLNSEKTEVLIIGPKNHKSNNLEHCLILDSCSVDSSSSVRNLGVLFDSNLSFDSNVSSISKTAFFNLKNISTDIYATDIALNVKCRNVNSCVYDLKVRLL